jgi:hypothetical protein
VVIVPFKIERVEPEPGKRFYLANTHWLDAMNPPTKEQIELLTEHVRAILPTISKVDVPPKRSDLESRASNRILSAQKGIRKRVSCLLTASAVIVLVLVIAILVASFGSSSPFSALAGQQKSGVLFEDEFSSQQASKDKGWQFGPRGDGTADRIWSANKYTMRVNRPDWWHFTSPSGTYADLGAEIVAQPNGAYGEYGIVFRATARTDADTCYVFGITSDGKYRFRKEVEGKWAASSLIPPTASQYINPGQAKNRLGVLAKGTSFSFYINGELVNTFNDVSITQGAVGIFVYSGANDRSEVGFSRLTVFTVEQAQIELAKQVK